MAETHLILYDEDLRLLEGTIRDLWRDANAKAVFVIDRNGMELASAGDVAQFDATSLSSLAAGNVAATDGLARLIGEREFSVLFHEGHQDHIHISVVGGRGILLVIFDARSSLGLVRLRVRQATPRVANVFQSVTTRESRPREASVGSTAEAPASGGSRRSPFSQITDEDIEALFGD